MVDSLRVAGCGEPVQLAKCRHPDPVLYARHPAESELNHRQRDLRADANEDGDRAA
jgi:hypothetical protein